MKSPVAGDDLMAACIESCQLDGVIDGAGATDGEESLLEIAGRDLRQAASQFTTGPCYAAGGNVADLLHLPGNGGGDTLVAMTNVHIHQAGREIQVTLAVVIIKINAFGIFDGNGVDAFLFAPGEEGVVEVI